MKTRLWKKSLWNWFERIQVHCVCKCCWELFNTLKFSTKKKTTRTSKNSMLILRRSIAYLKISGITFHIFIRLSTISLYGRELKKVFWIGVPTANRVSQTIYFRVLVRFFFQWWMETQYFVVAKSRLHDVNILRKIYLGSN